MNTPSDKIQIFAALVEKEHIERLHEQGLDCQANVDNARTKVKVGQKYTKVDVGTSGKFMVENATGNIFGIKGYGQVHKGHFYGTLDTITEYNWGNYYPARKDGELKRQKANGCPVITHAPEPPALVTQPTQEEEVRRWTQSRVF